MPDYRYYVFNEQNRIDRVIEFTATTDLDACEEVQKLRRQSGHGVLELWRDDKKIYCPER